MLPTNTAGSLDAATGIPLQPGTPGVVTPEGQRWIDLHAEYAKKADDQFYEEYPDLKPHHGEQAITEDATSGGVGNVPEAQIEEEPQQPEEHHDDNPE